MKVLHLLASNKYSGAENVVCQIIKMFDKEIEMAYCSPEGTISETLKDKKIKYIPLKKLSLKEIKKAINEYKPDVVHCHDLKAIVLCSNIGNVKKIAHIHVNHPKMKSVTIRSLIANKCLKNFQHIYWVSQSCLCDFKYHKKFLNKSTVLPNIISIEDLYKTIDINVKDSEKIYDIVYCGRITYQKNPLRILDIVEMLKRNKKDVKIVVCGDGDLYDIFKQETTKRGLEDNVELKGFVKNPASIIKQSKLMILTSFFEGTPMTALESMALGVPIVSTKTDGMKNLINEGKNGYLYETNEEAVNIIMRVLESPSRLSKIMSSSMKFAKDYNNIEKYKNKLKIIYELKGL